MGRVVAERTRRDRSVRGDVGVAVVALIVLAAAVCRPLLEDVLDRPAVANWATVFVAIAVQAMPFLVLGVAISAAVAAFVPPGFLPRVLPGGRRWPSRPPPRLAPRCPAASAVRSRSPGGSSPRAPRPPPRWRSCCRPRP